MSTTMSAVKRLTAQSARSRFLSEEESKTIANRLQDYATGGGETRIVITSQWRANVRSARNRIISSGDTQSLNVSIVRGINGAWGITSMNQMDEASLKAGVEFAERALRYQMEPTMYIEEPLIDAPYLKPNLWSEETFSLNAEARTTTANSLMDIARQKGMLSAGYAEVAANGMAVMHSTGLWRYYRHTTARYSVTVRDPKGTASGWAGVDWNDWNRIDAQQLCETALSKCLQSRNAVRVEPGRYTTILEPQAVCDLINSLVHPFPRNIEREDAENGGKPFSGEQSGTSKIGLTVMDSRLTMGADPMRDDCGFVPFTYDGVPYQPVKWVDSGVLRELAYGRRYAVENFHTQRALPNGGAMYLEGTEQTPIETMIATMSRGLLVTRFHEVSLIDPKSMLYSGYTRDGVWLIEHGKISKAVKNLRFLDSPLFALNNIEQIGVPQRVFHPGLPTVVPALKIRDFHFTSMSDAV